MIKVSFNVYHEPDSRFPTNDVLYQHNMEKIGKMIENIGFSNRASFFLEINGMKFSSLQATILE